METIAITGVRGFLGLNLVQRLQFDPEYKIVAIDKKKPDFLSESVKFFEVDLTNPSADMIIYDILEREGVDTFVHLAFFNAYIPRSSEYFHEVEVIGTWYVLNACAKRRIKRFIIASTTEVYGAHPMNPNLLKEDRAYQINPSYKQMKDRVEVEGLTKKFAKKNPNTKVYILRKCPILGDKAKNFMTWYLSGLLLFTILGYDPMMQFIHQEDILDAFELVIRDGSKPPGIYNIVGEGALPLSYVLRLAGKISIPIIHSVAYIIGFVMWRSGLCPYPPEHIDYLKYPVVADGRKARELLGFLPKYTAKQTVEEFAGIVKLKRIIREKPIYFGE